MGENLLPNDLCWAYKVFGTFADERNQRAVQEPGKSIHPCGVMNEGQVVQSQVMGHPGENRTDIGRRPQQRAPAFAKEHGQAKQFP